MQHAASKKLAARGFFRLKNTSTLSVYLNDIKRYTGSAVTQIDDVGYGTSANYHILRLTEFCRYDSPEVEFLENHVGSVDGMQCIELCSGTGRLGAALAARGAYAYCVDATPAMIDLSRLRLSKIDPRAQERLHLVLADASTVELPSGADLVILADGCLGYFLEDQQAGNLLSRCAESLASDGIMYLNIFDPATRAAKDRVLSSEWTRDIAHSEDGYSLVQFRRSSTVDTERNIIETEYNSFLFKPSTTGISYFDFKMRYRLRSGEAVAELLRSSGLRIERLFNNVLRKPNGEPLDDHAVYLCKRERAETV